MVNLVGVFGGTFDPPHLGHVSMISKALSAYPFQKFYVVPAGQNPHKPEPPRSSGTHRFSMIQLAVKEILDPRIEILDWEINRPGVSYTVDTLRKLAKGAQGELALVLGNEIFQGFPSWKESKAILQISHLIIVDRIKGKLQTGPAILESMGVVDLEQASSHHWCYLNNNRWLDILTFDALPFSATHLRSLLKKYPRQKSFPPKGLPPSVWEYVKQNHLYTDS